LAEHNVSHPETPLFVRFGLASGTPIPHEGDLYGISMSLAARMCQSAAPNQVLVSAEVAESAAGGHLAFRPLGPIAMKGFPEPLPAFAAERAA
jgi:class 3 adenylate cyclase